MNFFPNLRMCILMNAKLFLDASSHLCKRPCPSVRPLVGYAFVKIDETWPFVDYKEEEGVTRRKERRGGRSNKEEGATRVKE